MKLLDISFNNKPWTCWSFYLSVHLSVPPLSNHPQSDSCTELMQGKVKLFSCHSGLAYLRELYGNFVYRVVLEYYIIMIELKRVLTHRANLTGQGDGMNEWWMDDVTAPGQERNDKDSLVLGEDKTSRIGMMIKIRTKMNRSLLSS